MRKPDKPIIPAPIIPYRHPTQLTTNAMDMNVNASPMLWLADQNP